MPLTDTAIRALKPKATRYSRTDERGLVLEVFPTGGMLWHYRYRLNGKQERVTLGRYPALSLAGPTMGWLRAALLETLRLSRLTPPKVPAVTFLGSRERIVDTGRVHRIMGNWPGGRLEMIAGAEHEIVMERPKTRRRFFDAASALFDRHA